MENNGIIAKFRCDKNEIPEDYDTSSIQLNAVTCGSKENEEFFKYTPYGQLNMSVVKPEVAALLEVGEEYYVQIIPVKKK